MLSFETDVFTVTPEDPVLSRKLPSISVQMADRDPNERRGISFVVERSNRRRAQVVRHTVTADAWLLTMLLVFSFMGMSNGYVLPGGAATARGVAGFGPLVVARASPLKMQSAAAAVAGSQAGSADMSAIMAYLSWSDTADTTATPAAAEVSVPKKAAGPKKVGSAAELALELSMPPAVPTVVIFGAKMCRTCRSVQPKVERLATKMGARVLFLHHDKESEPAFREHGIKQTPTIQVYDENGSMISTGVYKVSDVSKLQSVLEEATA